MSAFLALLSVPHSIDLNSYGQAHRKKASQETGLQIFVFDSSTGTPGSHLPFQAMRLTRRHYGLRQSFLTLYSRVDGVIASVVQRTFRGCQTKGKYTTDTPVLPILPNLRVQMMPHRDSSPITLQPLSGRSLARELYGLPFCCYTCSVGYTPGQGLK